MRPTRSHVTTAGLFAFAHFSHHMSNALLTPMLPWIRTAFGLDYFQAGLLNSTFSTLYGVAQLPVATIADRMGRRFIMAWFALGGVSLAAMAVGLTNSYVQLLALLALMGIMGSAYHPLAGSLLGQQVAREHRGQAYGIHLIGGNSGFLVAPIVGAAIATAFGWRAAYMALPALGLVAAVLVLSTVEEPPLATANGTGSRGLAAMFGPFRTVLGLARPIIPILGTFILVNFVQAAVGAFLPLFLVDKHGVEMPVAATMVALISGAGIVGAPIGGTLSDKIGRQPVMVLSIALIGPFVYMITVVPFGVWLIAAVLLLGLSRSLAQPVVDSLLADTVPAELRATAFSLYFFLNSEMGGMGVPLVGWIIDNVGLDTAYTWMSGLVFAMSAVVVVVFNRERLLATTAALMPALRRRD